MTWLIALTFPMIVIVVATAAVVVVAFISSLCLVALLGIMN